MTDWFKVQMNEADRRITLEVYSKKMIEAVANGDMADIEFTAKLLKEKLDEPYDKYEGAE